jgi:hypothetical protein
VQVERDYTWVISDRLVTFKSYYPVVPYSYQRNTWLKVYQKSGRDETVASPLHLESENFKL